MEDTTRVLRWEGQNPSLFHDVFSPYEAHYPQNMEASVPRMRIYYTMKNPDL